MNALNQTRSERFFCLKIFLSGISSSKKHFQTERFADRKMKTRWLGQADSFEVFVQTFSRDRERCALFLGE